MYIPEGSYHSDRDYELESLLRQISELELETRGRCRRRSPEWSSHDRSLVSSHPERLLHQSHSWLLRDRLNESKDGDSVSLKREKGTPICCHERHKPSSKKDSPVAFFRGNECIEMSRHFTHPSFTCYNGKIDLVEHVSYFTQLMALYSWNDGCRYRIFSVLDLHGRHRKFPKNTIFSP